MFATGINDMNIESARWRPEVLVDKVDLVSSGREVMAGFVSSYWFSYI